MTNYYDLLQRIKDTAAMLQACPIPSDDVGQGRNLGRLEVAAESLRRMLIEIAPGVSVWCGAREDSLRKGMPMACDWDKLAAPLYNTDCEEAPKSAGESC